MLVPASSLFGFEISAADGTAGQVHDLQVDDRRWAVRDIVVDGGDGLTLIDPAAVWADHGRHTLRVALTAEQIAEAPGIESHPAVVHQHRVDPYNHLGRAAGWSSEDRRPPVFTVLETTPAKASRLGASIRICAACGSSATIDSTPTTARSVASGIGSSMIGRG